MLDGLPEQETFGVLATRPHFAGNLGAVFEKSPRYPLRVPVREDL